MQAHAQSVQEYSQQVDQPDPLDFFPFIAMLAGTTIHDLPDGGQLFTLACGALVRANADNSIVYIGLVYASVVVLEESSGGIVTLPDGRKLPLYPSVGFSY